jgi:hypothetical protein
MFGVAMKLCFALIAAGLSASAIAAGPSEIAMNVVDGQTPVSEVLALCEYAPKPNQSLTAEQKSQASAFYCLGYLSGLGDGYIVGEAMGRFQAGGDPASRSFCLDRLSNLEATAALRIGLNKKLIKPTDGIRAAYMAVLANLYPCSSGQ